MSCTVCVAWIPSGSSASSSAFQRLCSADSDTCLHLRSPMLLQFIPEGTDLKPILPVLANVFDQALDGGGAKNINFQELAADLAQITFDYPFRIPPYAPLHDSVYQKCCCARCCHAVVFVACRGLRGRLAGLSLRSMQILCPDHQGYFSPRRNCSRRRRGLCDH